VQYLWGEEAKIKSEARSPQASGRNNVRLFNTMARYSEEGLALAAAKEWNDLEVVAPMDRRCDCRAPGLPSGSRPLVAPGVLVLGGPSVGGVRARIQKD